MLNKRWHLGVAFVILISTLMACTKCESFQIVTCKGVECAHGKLFLDGFDRSGKLVHETWANLKSCDDVVQFCDLVFCDCNWTLTAVVGQQTYKKTVSAEDLEKLRNNRFWSMQSRLIRIEF